MLLKKASEKTKPAIKRVLNGHSGKGVNPLQQLADYQPAFLFFQGKDHGSDAQPDHQQVHLSVATD